MFNNRLYQDKPTQCRLTINNFSILFSVEITIIYIHKIANEHLKKSIANTIFYPPPNGL